MGQQLCIFRKRIKSKDQNLKQIKLYNIQYSHIYQLILILLVTPANTRSIERGFTEGLHAGTKELTELLSYFNHCKYIKIILYLTW